MDEEEAEEDPCHSMMTLVLWVADFTIAPGALVFEIGGESPVAVFAAAEEVLGSVVPAVVGDFLRSIFRREAVGTRLHADRVHQVAVVLVDGRVAEFCRRSRRGQLHQTNVADIALFLRP